MLFRHAVMISLFRLTFTATCARMSRPVAWNSEFAEAKPFEAKAISARTYSSRSLPEREMSTTSEQRSVRCTTGMVPCSFRLRSPLRMNSRSAKSFMHWYDREERTMGVPDFFTLAKKSNRWLFRLQI